MMNFYRLICFLGALLTLTLAEEIFEKKKGIMHICKKMKKRIERAQEKSFSK